LSNFVLFISYYSGATHSDMSQPVATCRQLPYLHKPAIVTVTSFSL